MGIVVVIKELLPRIIAFSRPHWLDRMAEVVRTGTPATGGRSTVFTWIRATPVPPPSHDHGTGPGGYGHQEG